MRTLVLLLALAAAASAQLLTFGAKVGVPFIDPAGVAGQSRNYTVGPAIEIHLPAGFAIEGSALYRRLGYSYLFLPQTGLYSSPGVSNRVRGNSWEFPVVVKYYFRPRESRWQPFLGTGWALRTIGYTYDGAVTTFTDWGQTSTPFHTHQRSDLGVGALLAAGVRLRAGKCG